MTPNLMMRSGCLICWTTAVVLIAQTTAGRTAGSPGRPRSGVVRIVEEPLFVPSSLKALALHASVIVDATVSAVQPARLVTGSNPAGGDSSWVETDSILTVSSALKSGGVTQGAKLIISQTGGRYGNLQVVTANDEIVEQGQRYILFLEPDTRPNLPTYGALPRFDVVGIWHGRFAVVDGKIRPSPISSLPAYNNATIGSFISEVSVALNP